MKNVFLFVAAIFIAGLSFQDAWSQDTNLSEPSLVERLRRSGAWEGTFTLKGLSTPVRLAFLPVLNARGELQYFHRFTGSIGSEILGFSKACTFTPRALLIQQTSVSAGKISLFACVDNEADELNLEANPDRESSEPIDVSEVALSPDGQALVIVAHAKGVTLSYQFSHQEVHPERPSTELPSRQELQVWLNR